MKRLFGYYRQFDELSPEEISQELLARRDEELRRHPATTPPLDLSGAAWHGPPHPEAINAATFALRRAVNAYPDSAPLRAAIAASHDIDPARVAIGHGAGELIRSALRAVATEETEVLWPGWGLLPGLVSEAGASPVPVAAAELAARRKATAAAPAARTLVAARPNDPTGAIIPLDHLIGDHWLILDEALAGFAELEVLDHPRVIQIRSFSKAHALAGLRIGYAIVPDGGPDLSPVLGVGAPALAAAAWAVEGGAESVRRRREQADAARERLAAEFPVAAGVGPYAWLALPVAEELAARRIYVAPGSAWGDEHHVRVTLPPEAAALDRLLEALRDNALNH
ncbi:pyridoxal phosphate-dependent aminotransferase [Solirubrobacter ginsenosidimutans]|uniref:Aminotransferase n=1 Tax=Solirubrobacter ginsenosidimutans TaxID=490573 RepID=A0A9X3S3I2_9ACTN|nr:pyridoxal phosphate-dependent aminotransferase [Solirubrobacter ginsenosidimutans]MDA0165765.1 pyridoxal phosphate-dependent aminotransferase [Solirubrobacter ginsenosidimutans]